MEDLLFRINLGIEFCIPCPLDARYNAICFTIVGLKRYARILEPREKFTSADVGYNAEDFISFYRYLNDLKRRRSTSKI